MASSTETYSYGNNASFEFEKLYLSHNASCGIPGVESAPERIERVTIDTEKYHQALDDINSTLKIYEDPESGKTFEIAVANKDLSEETVDIELSTFTSSITGNIGNAIEFAEHAALYPSRKRVYVASFGNGGTSYWDEKERQYIKATGKFVGPEGEALPTVTALERVLRNLGGLAIGRLSANSAGGAYATALMTALPEGQVSHAYLKSRPNISNHPTRLAWGIGLMLSEQLDNKRYKANTTDPWDLTDDIIADARPHLGSIYDKEAGEWSARGAFKESGLKRLWSDMVAFSKGGESYGYPAAVDTSYALRQQPDAKLTYHFPIKDRLYHDLRTDVGLFLSKLALSTSHIKDGQIEALYIPGTHHDHSQYPSLRWSAEKYALSR